MAYTFGSGGSKAVLWRSDTQIVEDPNLIFASRLPSGEVLEGAGPISLNDQVMVFVASNPASGRNEIGLLIGEDPFRAGP